MGQTGARGVFHFHDKKFTPLIFPQLDETKPQKEKGAQPLGSAFWIRIIKPYAIMVGDERLELPTSSV